MEENNKIKVLHLITRMILGGAQENTLATVKILSEKSEYEVTLATGPPIGPEGSLMEEAERTKAEIVLISELRREINPLLDAISFIKLYILILRGKYDIVHTHSSKAGILGRIAAKLAGTKRVIHTIHGLPFHPYQNRFLNFIYVWLEKFAALFSNRIITVCDAMKEKAVSHRIGHEGKFLTIYSGMNLDQFLKAGKDTTGIRKKLGIGKDDIVIGKIGRFFPLKGHKYFIRAAPLVVKTFPDVKFLLIGDGILRDKLKSEVINLGLRDKFIFAGLVDRKEVPGLITAMDILVHTSLREGLPRVLVQAMVCGKPVISFDIDGAGEVVLEGKTGFLVPPGDVVALANTIISALSDVKGLEAMGKTGCGLAGSLFSEKIMVERIDKLYKELL